MTRWRNRSKPFGHAIVAGGSMTGLLAARVLASYFERVTVLERDIPSASPEPRTGVPQGRHLHALLVRGRMIIESMFPGVTEDLRRDGALLLDAGQDLAWYHAGGFRAAAQGAFEILCLSRPMLEFHLAARVRALPNVTWRGGIRVQGLLSDGSGQITGVRVRECGKSGAETALQGELVIDALGRGSPMSRWTEELGFEPVRTDVLPARVAYASCLFDNSRGKLRPILVTGAPASRSGGMFPIEGGRSLLTLIGFFQEDMPTTHEDMLAFARSLPVPDLWDAARQLAPLSDVHAYRFPGSQRRQYRQLMQVPGGLIAMGDAVCSFNPVYGQGMTVSAIEAEALGATLAAMGDEDRFNADFVRNWFGRIDPVVSAAWDGVSIEDLRFPQLADRRPFSLRPIQWYMSRVHRATHRSSQVTRQFYRVMNFLDGPSTLFRPGLAADVLFGRSRKALLHDRKPRGVTPKARDLGNVEQEGRGLRLVAEDLHLEVAARRRRTNGQRLV